MESINYIKMKTIGNNNCWVYLDYKIKITNDPTIYYIKHTFSSVQYSDELNTIFDQEKPLTEEDEKFILNCIY